MSRREKAARILAVLVRSNRAIAFIEIEDIEDKCSESELDFYYFWIVMGGKTNGYDT